MRIPSGKFTVYKKSGAAQFQPIAPRTNDKGYIEQDGAILIEVAPGIPSGKDLAWDWSRKISFAIGVADICRLMENPDQPPKLVHSKNDFTKTLEFVPGTGNFEGTYQMKVFVKQGSETNNVTVPLAGGEYQVIIRSLVAMVPHLLGWL